MKFEEILDKIGPVPYLAIAEGCSLQEASELVTQKPQIRGIYVVDAKDRLTGYLSLGLLIRHVVMTQQKPRFHVRSLLTTITAKTVADIMERQVICARPEDTLTGVLDKMLMRNIKQVPIVNPEHQIITAAGILDIWKWIQW